MIIIKKENLPNFLKAASNGEATVATHAIFPLTSSKERGEAEDLYFSHHGETEKDIKNNFLLDIKDEKLFMSYAMFRVKERETAQINDIFVGYDGVNYNFSMNEDTELFTRVIKKDKDVIFSSFQEIYTEMNELPKEFKFLLSKIDVKHLVEFHNNYSKILNSKNLDASLEKTSSKKEEKTKEVKKEEVEKNLSHNSQAMDRENTNNSGFSQPMMVQTISNEIQIDKEYSSKIEAFKRHLGAKILQEKEDNSKISFRNIKYPLPSNPLEKAIFLNGGTKPILCYGQQGSGKSFTAEHYAKQIEEAIGIPVAFYSILLEKNLDKADIVGSPVLKDDAFNYQKMAEAFMSARDGNLTIFLVDEIFRLKEMGTFFNLFGESHYKLDTGRQLEVVELITEDIDGEMQTSHFCLSDRKVLNPNLIVEPFKVRLLKNKNDELFKRVPEQKIKDKLALGEIPIIERSDYVKYGLESLKVSSFYTSEQIKAPIEKMIIIAAGNIGSEYQAHFKLDTDKAFRSRFAICEQPAPELKDYLRVFKLELEKALKNDYIMWDKFKHENFEVEIKNLEKYVKNIFTELFKAVKQKSFSTSSNFSHRNFVELAHNLCKQTTIDSKTIKECFEAQEKALLSHTEGKNSRIPVEKDLVTYYAIIDSVLEGKPKGIQKQHTIEEEEQLQNAIHR